MLVHVEAVAPVPYPGALVDMVVHDIHALPALSDLGRVSVGKPTNMDTKRKPGYLDLGGYYRRQFSQTKNS